MFGVGTGEILLILVIALLVVGPERMAEFGAQLGRALAKFRQETDSMTQEFREAFALESGEEGDAESTSETASAQGSGVLSEDMAEAAEEAPEEGLAAESLPAISAGVEEPEEPEHEQLGYGDPFLDREMEVGPSLEEAAAEEEGRGTREAAEEVEPVSIQVGELVPEDEDVEPTLIEQPVLVGDRNPADASVDEDPGSEG